MFEEVYESKQMVFTPSITETISKAEECAN